MKKQLLFLVIMMLPLVASANPFEINGIYYNLVTKLKQAEVTKHPSQYSGDVIIPKTVTFENEIYSVTSIEAFAFSNCTALTSITIPNSVTEIGVCALAGCTSLTSVAIPNSMTYIPDQFCHSCTNLTSVTIPNSVTTLVNRAFAFCSSLTSITIPNSVTEIGSDVFIGCSALTSVTIPNSVTNIASGAFWQCSGLKSINIPNSITRLSQDIFRDCSNLKAITIPSSIIYIDSSAFYGCTSLTSITIPNSVTSIGYYAFYQCNGLTTVTIGNGIKFIEDNAFGTCPNLSDVTCYAENVPNTNSNAFKDSYIDYATLHVPSASVNAYKAKDPWKNFKSIVAIDGEAPTTQKCEKPTISYENGQLKFASATDGVEFISEITDSDIKKNYEATVSLTATYNISVYATKSGYDNSDVATATLSWIDASPKTEGITNGVAQIAARPVLVKTDNGFITVEGADDRTNVSVYTTDGKQVGSAISQNNIATIATSIQPGAIAIVKVGDKAVKVVIK